MDRFRNPNLDILSLAVDRLGGLTNKMVFVGGCATGLLITDRAAPPMRVTRDVDAIVSVLSRADYYALSEQLRDCGFSEDISEGAPLCRWRHDQIILDVMPTDESILGFGNRWYEPAMEHANSVLLPSGQSIRLISSPYFLMTKLEAVTGRGGGDYQQSHDMEDIVAVLDGRPKILDEIKLANSDLLHELSDQFTELLKQQRFVDAVSGHMPPDEASQARVSSVIDKIKTISRI